MRAMKVAGIRELKARLSAYIRAVESGETVLVTDRGRVVAQMTSPGAMIAADGVAELRCRKLIARGSVRPAINPRDKSWVKARRLMNRDDVKALLDAERQE